MSQLTQHQSGKHLGIVENQGSRQGKQISATCARLIGSICLETDATAIAPVGMFWLSKRGIATAVTPFWVLPSLTA